MNTHEYSLPINFAVMIHGHKSQPRSGGSFSLAPAGLSISLKISPIAPAKSPQFTSTWEHLCGASFKFAKGFGIPNPPPLKRHFR
jgi:hypothetical protein